MSNDPPEPQPITQPQLQPKALPVEIIHRFQTEQVSPHSHTHPDAGASPPGHSARTNAEIEREKQREGKKSKRSKLGEALRRLRVQRESIERQGDVAYESFWADQDDPWTRQEIEFAQSMVEECFDLAEAECFRAEIDEPPADSQFPKYDRAVMHLKQHEGRLKNLMCRIQ